MRGGRRPIRILHVVDTMLGMGGMEKNVVSLIRRMNTELFEHAVCVIRSLGTLAGELPRGRVPMICLGRTETGRSFLVRRLARVISDVKPDIVHSRNWGAIETVFAAGWASSCARVHSEHGMDSANFQSEPLRRRLLRRLAFQMADRVFSVSHGLREIHSRNTGFPLEKIGVIHNGVDTERFQPRHSVRIRVRRDLGISPNEFCIGAVGRLEPVKDLPTLMRAAAAAFGSAGAWRLLIAGDGSESSALRALVAAQPELGNRVCFLGETQQISELLNAFDLYALPSLYEGISNSLLEAMASGLPVVATAVGGNTEVVVDRQSGLLFPPGAIQELTLRLRQVSDEPELSKRLGQRALEHVRKHFSLESMVRQYEMLYSGL